MTSWLQAPRFEGRERTRIAATLHAICLTFGAALLGTLAVAGALSPRSLLSAGAAVNLVAVALIACSLAMLRTGRVRAASALVVGMAFSVTTLSLVLAGGISSPAYSAYILAIVAAGLLLGTRAAISVALVCVGVGAGIGVLEARGMLPEPVIPYASVSSYWLAELILFASVAGLMVVSLARIREALREAEVSEAALAERNRQLEASREQVRALADNASDLILEFDDAGRCIFISSNVGALLGQAPEDFMGRRFEDCLGEAERSAFHESLSALLEHGRSTEGYIGLRMQHRDGAWRHFEMSLSRFTDAAGLVRVVSVSRDVTERQRAERTTALLRAGMDQAGDSILIVDLRGRVIYANAAFERLSGRNRDEIMGATAQNLLAGFDEERGAEILETLSRGEIWRGRVEPLLRDGSRPIRSATFAPVSGVDGAPTPSAVIAVIRDVTRQVRLEEDLRQAQKMEAVGQLAGGVAHDFNNLLLIISGYSRMLQRRLADDPESLELVEQVRGASARAAELTEQLLTFGRRQVFRPRVVPLNTIVEQATGMLRRLVRENVEIEMDLAPDVACVRVDPGQIQQLLLNLAANARDAMPEGGRITIRTSRHDSATLRDTSGGLRVGEAVRLTVEDTGVGISPEIRDHLFEPFYTTKEVGKGTGLGLASVYAIVERCGGTIEVESAPGDGARFHVNLPRTDEIPEAAVATDTTETLAFRPATVLLVEDEQGVRRLMCEVLEEEGYEVLSARDGSAALELLEERDEPLDAVVTDVVMPRMDGPTLIAKLGARWPRLGIVYVSGHPREDFTMADDARMAYLAKPFDPDLLLESLRAVLAS